MEGDELPAGWSMATLADMGQWTSGGTPSKKRPDYHNGHIPWVLTGDLDDGPVKDVPNSITDAGLKNSSAKVFPTSTLLMAMYGATIGKLGILQREAATNQACAALLPSDGNREALPYVYFYLLSQRENFKKAGKGGAQPNISQGVVKDTAIPVAPLPEQQRIVEKIETLFAELGKGEEALREVQKLLARYRQSVLKAAVTGTLTADWRAANGSRQESGKDLLARILKTRRDTWQGRGNYQEPVEPTTDGLPELPQGWVWASVEQLATVLGGLTKNKKRGEMPLKRPMLRVANVYQDRLELEDIHETGITVGELERVTLRDKDMLVVEGNGSKDQIGRMAVWNCEILDAVHQNHLIKVRMVEPATVAFAMIWFRSSMGRQNIELVASSTSGLYTLSISKIERLAVPLPTTDEMLEVCERLDEAFTRIAPLHDWCETELKRSAALRQSILKDAFSGKLVPQDPCDEPADKLLERIRAVRAEKPKAKRKKAAA